MLPTLRQQQHLENASPARQILFSNFAALILYVGRRADLAKVQLTNKSDNYKKTGEQASGNARTAPQDRTQEQQQPGAGQAVNFVCQLRMRMQIILQKLKADDSKTFT